MSRRDLTLVSGILGLILMGVPAWDVLDKRGWSSITMLMSVGWLVGAALLIWAVYRNVHDASRAESLHAQIVTLRDEHKIHRSALEKSENEAQARFREAASKRDELQQDQGRLLAEVKKMHELEAINKALESEVKYFRCIGDSDLNAREGRFHFIDCSVTGLTLSAPMPYIELSIQLINLSVFDAEVVTLGEKLLLDNHPLRDVPQFRDTTRTITIKHGESIELPLRQYLDEETARRVRESKNPTVLKAGRFFAIIVVQDQRGDKYEVRREFPNVAFTIPVSASAEL